MLLAQTENSDDQKCGRRGHEMRTQNLRFSSQNAKPLELTINGQTDTSGDITLASIP